MNSLHPVEPASRSAIQRPALHLEVVERLLDMITDGSLAPEERINEREICEQLGVSRTPLREALLVLQAEGMVVQSPRRGARVTKPSPRQIREILEMLGGIEAVAGELACRKATDAEIARVAAWHQTMVERYRMEDMLGYFKINEAIHGEIVRMADNLEIAKVHSGLRRRIARALYLPNVRNERWREAIAEHDGFVEALQRRDGPRLAAMLKEHTQHTWDDLERSSENT